MSVGALLAKLKLVVSVEVLPAKSVLTTAKFLVPLVTRLLGSVTLHWPLESTGVNSVVPMVRLSLSALV